MSIKSTIKTVLVALTAAAVLATGVSQVSARQQIDINNPGDQPIDKPVFNIYTNVPYGTGNEADFVRLRKSNGDPTVPANTSGFVDPLSAACAVGEKFDVRTYVHNGANERFNNNGSGPGVARNVNVAMQAPLGVTNKNFTFQSTITASNAGSLTDTGVLNCANNVQLKLVPQTVKVYSRHTGWNGAPDGSVNGNLKIGSRTVGSGDVWGCWEDVTVVVYTVEVVKAPQPKPEVRCDAILVDKIGERKYRYGIRYTATNGATLKSVKYYFDKVNNPENNRTVTAPFTTEYEYAQAGEFRVTTDLTFAIPGQTDRVVTDDKCATTIKTEVKPCPVPGKSHLPEGHPECEEKPVTPPVTVIPSTGIGSILGGLVGSSAAAYSGYALYQKRRALSALKK